MRLLLEILEITSTATFVSGLFLNSLLLFLIVRFSTKELGTYKYLLEIFVAYDIYLVIVHHVTNPKVIPSHSGFGIISDRGYGVLPILCFQSSCYAVPFALLNIHLLYRYWTIREFETLKTWKTYYKLSPHKIGLFSQPKFIALLISTTIFLQINWFMSCYYLGKPENVDDVRRYQSLFQQEYGKEINDGPLLLDYWKDGQLCIRPLLFLIVADTVEIFTVCVAISIATLTYRLIMSSKNLSETIRTFQLRILLAASAQTLTPVICVYTPYFLNVTMPLFSIYSPTFSALSMVLVSFFPCIDAVVILLLMKPYRDGLLKMLGMQKVQQNAVAALSFTASTNNNNAI